MFRMVAALGRVLGVTSIAMLTLLVGGEVFSRLAFGVSFEFMEEVAGYLIVAITFLATADSFASGRFMRVDMLYARFSPVLQRRLTRALALIAASLCAAIGYYMLRLVGSSIANGIVSPTLAAIPLWMPQTMMAIGTFLLAIACLREAIAPGASAAEPGPADRLQD